MAKRIDKITKLNVVSLYRDGCPVYQISQHFEISDGSVYRIVREYERMEVEDESIDNRRDGVCAGQDSDATPTSE